jgi:hypothetical protein
MNLDIQSRDIEILANFDKCLPPVKALGANLKSRSLVLCVFKHDQIEFLFYENAVDDEIGS